MPNVCDFKEKKLITVDPEEFNEIVKRIHKLLVSRADNAKDKKEMRPTKKSRSNHVEAAKDAFVFSHMIELIEHMSHEISNLREMLTSFNDVPEMGPDLPDVFAPKKTHFLN